MLMAESKEELITFLLKVKEDSEKAALKLNIKRKKTKSWQKKKKELNHGIQSYYLVANKRRESRSSNRFYFLGLQNHCRQYLQPWN